MDVSNEYLSNLFCSFSDIGNWEKYTRGIGAKLLGKVRIHDFGIVLFKSKSI